MSNEDKPLPAVVAANEGPQEPTSVVLSDTQATAVATPQTTIDTSAERACQNCGHSLDGPFCGMCGQPERSVIRFFGSVIFHFLDDIVGWDTRASRTFLPLMFRPGFLTNEYLRGRRVHYVPPLRLYFIVSIMFFLVLQLSTGDSVKELVKAQQGNTEQISKIVSDIDKLRAKMAQPDYVANQDDNKRLADLTERKQEVLADLQNTIDKMQEKIDEIKARQAEPGYEEDPADVIQLSTFEVTVDNMRRNLKEVTNSTQSSAQDSADDKTAFVGMNVGSKAKANVSVDFGEGFFFLSDEQNKRLVEFGHQMEVKAKESLEKDAGPLIKQVLSVLPHTMFVLLPIFALLLKMLYLFSRRYYMEHLMVALHSHAFIFVNLLIITLLSTLHEWIPKSFNDVADIIEYLISGFVLWIPIYLFIMQKRVYKQGVFFTLVKFGLVGFSYVMLLCLTMAIAFFWGLAKL